MTLIGFMFECLHEYHVIAKSEQDELEHCLYFRLSEFVALVSLSTTLFLFLHTRSLSQRLEDIRRPFDPSAGQLA
jgi:hypothetical protein